VILLTKNGPAGGEDSVSEHKSLENGRSIENEGDKLEKLSESSSQSQAELCMRKGGMMIGYGQTTGLQGKAGHGELCAFNAAQELWACRETLRKLMGEVESSLARLDWAFKNLEGLGPGQGSISRIQASPKDKEKWMKPKKRIKSKWVGSGFLTKAGAGTGPKPSDFKRPVQELGRANVGTVRIPGPGRWRILSRAETAAPVGLGKSTSTNPDIPESSEERGFDCAVPVSSKEELGSSLDGQGVPEEGASAPVLVAASSVGLGKSTPTCTVVLESPDEIVFNLAAPVSSKERQGSSSGERGVTEGVASPVLVVGEVRRPVCLDSKSSASVKALQTENGEGSKYAGMSVPLENGTGVSDSKQAEQRVYLRNVCSSHKTTKSWVAERCAWNDDRGVSSSLGILGKPLVVNVTNMVSGESEGIGISEEMVAQEGMSEDIDWKTQGISLSSPVVKEMKRVWEVREVAGLSCDGQEGKLKDTLGQIVVNKYGNVASSSAEGEAENITRLRDDCSFYEA
jgi:hypothetical protein